MSALSFAAPLVLIALLALPVIWWLLRVTPPAPQRRTFFGLRFLTGLRSEEETPDKTPLWLLLMRLAAAALIVAALAEPILNASRTLSQTDDALLLVVDDSWAAAHRWDERRDEMRAAIDDARRADAPVILAPTASPDFDIRVEDPQSALARAMALEPRPLPADRKATVAKLRAAMQGRHARVVWLSDGVAEPDLGQALSELLGYGETDVYQDGDLTPAIALATPGHDAAGLILSLLRAEPGPLLEGRVNAFGANGAFIASAPFRFEAGKTRASARIDAPTALRNDIERIAVEGRPSAGSVALLDESARQRPVGVTSGDEGRTEQPLLSSVHYLLGALNGVAEVRAGAALEHVNRGVSMLILADVGQIVGEERDALTRWVEAGGVLVRFAGPRLAAGGDDLLPVTLRRSGARAMGGALSWEKPQGLGGFSPESPFAGLKPPADIQVRRQVLAEPSVDLESRTWASLADGTPLVTARKRGEGWIVLFHVTANAEWSNLPLSGLFVDMLKRLIPLGKGVGDDAAKDAAAQGALNPRLVLDGYGRPTRPGPSVQPIQREGAKPTPETPPGLYGAGGASYALNLFGPDATLEPFPDLPGGAAFKSYGARVETDLKPWLLGGALALLFIDAVASLLLRGYRPRLRRGLAAVALLPLLAAPFIAPPDALAQAQAEKNAEAALRPRLAYVVTGDAAIDRMSAEGLAGLTQILNNRTSFEAAEPAAVDIENDDLAFYPLLYWPLTPNAPLPSDQAIARVDAYMKNGGTILFDSREGADAGPASDAMQSLLRRLDLPPLQRTPRDHVLTKAFYLLSAFPGRQQGDVWVEARRVDADGVSEALGDGVSSVVIGGGDWAAAWAADQWGRGLYPMGPGGERQREYAYRFGVNLVMYALTGNYKADQVHVPALLERMGQ